MGYVGHGLWALKHVALLDEIHLRRHEHIEAVRGRPLWRDGEDGALRKQRVLVVLGPNDHDSVAAP